MFQFPEAAVALRPRIALTVVLVAVLGGCMGAPRSNWRAGSRGLPLEAWVTIAQDSSGTIQPQVGVSLPYRSLVFHRDQDQYRSGLRVTVIAERDGQQVGGGVATREIAVDQTVDRRGDRTLEVRAPVRLRGQAEVTLEVLAEVPGTARRWRRQLALDPRMLSAAPLLIGDIHTNLNPGRDGRQVLTSAHDTLRLAVDVLRPARAPAWPSGGVELVASISGPVRDDRRQWRQAAPVLPDTGGSDSVQLQLPVRELPFGGLDLQLAATWRQDGSLLQLPREPAVALVNLCVPLHDGAAWRQHLEWLDGQVATAALDSLARLPAGARPAAWARLWRQLAGQNGEEVTAATMRHLWRIVDADARFRGLERGARSDRGRVYVRWGEPARVETYADARIPGATWEVWTYSVARRRFAFHDVHGLGDFRLRRSESF